MRQSACGPHRIRRNPAQFVRILFAEHGQNTRSISFVAHHVPNARVFIQLWALARFLIGCAESIHTAIEPAPFAKTCAVQHTRDLLDKTGSRHTHGIGQFWRKRSALATDEPRPTATAGVNRGVKKAQKQPGLERIELTHGPFSAFMKSKGSRAYTDSPRHIHSQRGESA